MPPLGFNLDFLKSEAERKRDKYLRLYHKIEDLKREHDKMVDDAESYYATYKSGLPRLDEWAIPNNDFVPALERLEERLNTYLDLEKDHRIRLVQAANQAHQRYLHYKTKAMEEA